MYLDKEPAHHDRKDDIYDFFAIAHAMKAHLLFVRDLLRIPHTTDFI